MQIAEAFVEVQMRLDSSTVGRAKSQVTSATREMERTGKVKLSTDNKPLKSGLDDAEGAVDRSARSMTEVFTRVFTAAAVIAGFKEAIGAASDLGESINAVNVTYGDSAEGVRALGEEAATQLGLSTEAFNGLAVQFAGFAEQIAGPGGDVVGVLDDLTTRAADFASVMNIDVSEAAEIFQSSLAGETEAIRRYGIDLSAAAVEAHALETGITDGSHAMTEAEKVQARYSLLMQETNKVAGDFANTSDSVANKQRIAAAEFENAKAKLGTALLPIYSQAIDVLIELVDVFSSLPAPVQAGIVSMLGIAAVAGPVRDAAKAFGGLSSIIGKLGGAAGPLGALALAAGAAALIVHSMGAEQRELEARSREVGGALGEQTTAVLDLAAAAETATTEVDGLALANSALGLALVNTGVDGEKIRKAFGTLGLSIQDVVFWMDTLQGTTAQRGSALEEMARQAGVAEEHLFLLADVVETTDNNTAISANLWRRLQDELGLTGDQAAELVGELLPVAEAMEEVDDQSEKFDGNAATREFLQLAAGANDTANGLITMAEAQSDLSRNGEHTRSVMATLLEIITALPPEAEAAARAALGLDGASSDLAVSADAATAALEGAEAPARLINRAYSELGDSAKKMGEETTKGGEAVEEAASGNHLIVRSYGELGDSMKEMGEEATKSGDAAEDAGGDFDDLADTIGDTTDEFDDLAAAANTLRAAIDKAINPALDLQASQDALIGNAQALTQAFIDNGVTLDAATEAGRTNREQVRENVQGFIDFAANQVAAGVSVEDATDALFSNVDALREQLLQAGFNKDQVDDLIESLNLMPEDKATVLEIVGEQAAQQVIDRYEENLDEIPDYARTQIQAAIRQGDIARANALLDSILDPQVRVRVNLPGLPRIRYVGDTPTYDYSGGTGPVALARGAFVGEDMLAQLHANEAVIPLSRPGRIRDLLADPRIGEPIAEAVGGDASGIVGGGWSVGQINVGSREDVPLIVDALGDVVFLARHG